MGRRSTYPWFHWFDEDQHQIPRSRFAGLSDKSVISTVQIQAKRMNVKARVNVSERWVWIKAERISRNSLTPAPAQR